MEAASGVEQDESYGMADRWDGHPRQPGPGIIREKQYMAEPAYKINDRKGLDSAYWAGRTNTLIKSATQTDQRQWINRLDRDVHRNVSNYGRVELMTGGRNLYSNNPVVRGAINEMALLAGAVYTPQFAGEDKIGYGALAEDWIAEHDKICDVAGWNYGMAQYRQNLIRSVIVDGDVGTLLTETGTGYPMLQTVPAHRIGSMFYFGGTNTGGVAASGVDMVVRGGVNDGARIVDGVILSDYGAPLAYRIQDASTAEGYRDVTSDSMFLSFLPDYAGQVRGFSQLACSTFVWQDIDESTELRMARAKLAASVGLIEKNETGTVDETQTRLQSAYSQFNTAGTDTTKPATALLNYRTEVVAGLTNRIYKAGTGSGLDFLENNNPSLNEREFEAEMIRRGLHGIGWSYDFSLNPTGMGGQNGRVVVAKINRRVKQLQDMILKPAISRFDGYRLSKAAKRGDLPFNVEWWKWTYQTAAELTSDEGYSSQVALNELRAGIRTSRQVCAARGLDLDEVRAQRMSEVDSLLTQAAAITKKHGLPLQQAIAMLQDTATYTTLTNAAAIAADPSADTTATK